MQNHPSAAKAALSVSDLAARLKSCPFKTEQKRESLASCEVAAFRSSAEIRVFQQTVKSCPIKTAQRREFFQQVVKLRERLDFNKKKRHFSRAILTRNLAVASTSMEPFSQPRY
jgi:hypothetical protein